MKGKVKLLSHVRLFATPWIGAYQARLFMEFSRQEYWSVLPFSSPGDLPDPGSKARFPTLQAKALLSEPWGKPILYIVVYTYREGNGTPLQYSCLENPMDGGAWWAAVHGVAKRHDWATSLSLFTFMHWGRKWQPTPVFWPGESQGQGSLVGCRLWGHTESDTTEVT